MPLLCELGWHRPAQFPRWTNGYYLSKCRRCGRDIAKPEQGAWAPVAGQGAAAPARRSGPLFFGAALAVAATLALLRNTAPGGEEEPPPPPPPPPQVLPGQSPAPAQGAEPGARVAPSPTAKRAWRSGGWSLVTASLLQCRSAASSDAPIRKRLRRGAPVLVLESRSGWARISHRQSQCWVRDIYIAPAEGPVSEHGERAFLDPRPAARPRLT